MKLRYMIDSVLKDRTAAVPVFEPVGLWVQGYVPGLDIEMYYIESTDPKVAERQEEAAWIVNRLVENDITAIPADFLEYHQLSRSPYDGTFSEITETDQYPSFDACAKAVLASIASSR